MAEEWFEDQEFWKKFRNHLYSERRLEEAEEMVENIILLTGIEEGKVMDMPCGVGRHSLEFVDRGFEVKGIDISQSFIEEANQKAENREIEFVQGDMREFSEEGEFDLAVNLFTSFGYFEDEKENMKVLENFHRSLKEGGMLVIETLGKEVLALNGVSGNHWTDKDGRYFLMKHEVTQNWRWHDMTWIMFSEGEIKENTVKHRLYSADELAEMVGKAGFSNVELHGDLDGREYDQEAERLVVVAEK